MVRDDTATRAAEQEQFPAFQPFIVSAAPNRVRRRGGHAQRARSALGGAQDLDDKKSFNETVCLYRSA